jgi:hypothetical protein
VQGHEEEDFWDYIDGDRIDFNLGEIKREESSEEIESDADSDSEKIIAYENKLTSDYIIPQERRLFVLYLGSHTYDYSELGNLMHTVDCRLIEELTALRQVFRVSQDQLDSSGIYMLDYDSEAFVWVGNNVKPRDKIGQAI